MNRLFTACAWLLAIALSHPAGAEDGRKQLLFERPGFADMRVFVTEPAGLNAGTPLVFVMHGMRRNADEYRDQWHDLALQNGFLLVVPEFSEAAFPSSRAYNFGNVFDEQGRQQPRADWSFSVIEPLFDDLVKRYGLNTERYAMYGHSAGAQFVHRFLLHTPDARASSIVSANAGSYTMPDFNVDYPYGLRGSAISPASLTGVFQLPVTILLGDRDIDPNHRSLPDAPAAQLQGPNRLARGFAFFEAGRRTAAELEVPFNWHIATVRGVAHDNAGMAEAAAKLLLD
jgi:poly(3-hydroxybutyrate) depolymerase